MEDALEALAWCYTYDCKEEFGLPDAQLAAGPDAWLRLARVRRGTPSNITSLMRLFTLLVSALFVVGGVGMIVSGDSSGWFVAGFFGLCLLVALFEPYFPKPDVSCDYRLLMTRDEVACEHPKRKRESIRWDAVNRIWYVTTSNGPWFPDEWLLLEGEDGGCSFPTEAMGIEGIWDELKQRFAGFDYGPIIRGGTDDAKHLCWERQRLSSRCT